MHILKRKNTYYYKLKIPKDIKHLIPKNEIRFSLHTHLKRDAIHLSSMLTSKYFTLFSKIRTGLYTEEEFLYSISDEFYLNLNQLNLNNRQTIKPIKNLKELSRKYSEDKLLTKSWTTKTFKAYTFVFMVFSKVINTNQDINRITREDLQRYKSILIKLPIIKPHQHKLSLEEILLLDNKIISTSTAQKYLSYISSLFKWCEEEGYVSKSVASGLFIKNDKNKESPRVPYSTTDLKSLFYQSTLYTKDFNKTLSEHPERIFLPLISMYQGMRLNEIAQLYTDDIKLIDGVYCIDINTNTTDKRLKNTSSTRLIPIHDELIELGFIDYFKKQKKLKRVRIWSELSLGLEGYGTNFRKWFGLFNRKQITRDRTKTFHSFRHLFTHTLKQISLKEDIDHHAVKYLLGHSVANDITMSVYTHGYNMKDLAEVLNKLHYKGLVLDELKIKLGSYRE